MSSFSKKNRKNKIILGLYFIIFFFTLSNQQAKASITELAYFPVDFSTQGRIEIKAQLIGFSASSYISTGSSPYLFRTATSAGNGGCCYLGFNGNDGGGGGGLTGNFETAAYIHDTAATGPYYQPYTYGSILGNQQSVDSWHTYDLVWNVNGIPQAGGNKVAVFIDGQLNSTYYQNGFSPHFSGSGSLIIGGTQTSLPGDIAFDELRVWSTSDQAPETLVLANSFESQELISSVGENGVYIYGRFSNGAVGNAISSVPIPSALWLFISWLPVLFIHTKQKKK